MNEFEIDLLNLAYMNFGEDINGFRSVVFKYHSGEEKKFELGRTESLGFVVPLPPQEQKG